MITDEIRRISDKLASVLSPVQIWLFGSFAQDAAALGSDYDFYIVVPDNAGDQIALMQKAYKAIRGLRRRPVDIVLGYESAFQKSSQEVTLENDVIKHGVLLYAQ